MRFTPGRMSKLLLIEFRCCPDFSMKLSQRFTDALTFATALHANQTRKGNGVPYIAHLLAVASIALEYGANEDEAIAALLHDAIGVIR